ncbi:hypothetical protein B0H17DRAFT_1061872 [Mycena rosella]|uniref:Uncharacterized protein n=1 Tax=Mycena rosella TaxID=1033263 RepID=A0AAD7GJJ6_MYCRO|nr:hypothetical protein B0H17DRAFT_1061872 [Mycena rosella]
MHDTPRIRGPLCARGMRWHPPHVPARRQCSKERREDEGGRTHCTPQAPVARNLKDSSHPAPAAAPR